MSPSRSVPTIMMDDEYKELREKPNLTKDSKVLHFSQPRHTDPAALEKYYPKLRKDKCYSCYFLKEDKTNYQKKS